jgi:predicted Zn-dependent protease
MRSVGFGQLLVLLAILALLLGGTVMKWLLGNLGTWAGSKALTMRWIYLHLGGGTDASKLRAEQAVGRQMANEILKGQPASAQSGELPAAVSRVGSMLAALVPDRVFRFNVLPSNQLNAYAIPGGYVFITSALAEMCRHDESGMAFVLGHEMGHVILEHPAERMTLNMAISVFDARMVQELFIKGYSRQQEIAADGNAVELMTKAGYDRRGAERVLALLARSSEKDGGGWLSTHPSPAERMAAILG